MLWVALVALFVVAAVACGWAAVRALSIYDAAVRPPLVVFLSLTAVWALSNTLLVLPGVSTEFMYGAYLVGLAVGLGTVPAWLWFCSAYAGKPYHYDRRLQALVLGLTAVIVLVKFTNPAHELYFVPNVATEPFAHFAPETGLVYWTVTTLAYIGSAVGLYILFDVYATSRVRARKLAWLTALLALPVVPKLLAVARPNTLALLFYEPLGVAAFGVGVVTLVRESFLSVRAPARRQLADALEDLVVVLDQNDRVVDHNDSAEAMFDSPDGVVGQPLAAVCPDLAAGLDSDEPISLDGVDGYYVVTTAPVDLGRRTVGRAVLLSNVTELESQRRRLEQQAEHRLELTEGIAHELRNPLTIITGQLEAARRNGEASDEHLDAALSATGRMAGIVDDLVDIVRYGRPVTETEPLAAATLLNRAWAMTDGEGQLDVALPEGTRIVGERARATELFRLLFRTHQQRGAETVRVEQTDEGLAVAGDGEQFAVEDPTSLFEYGVETGAEVRMSLANAHTLAQVHGWSLRADTDAPGPRFVLDGVVLSTELDEVAQDP